MKSLNIKINTMVRSFLNKNGFNLVKISENYINDKWSSPIELIYRTHKEYILISTPITDLRFLSFHGYKAGHSSNSPFVTAIKEYIDDHSKSYTESSLYDFYSDFRPNSIAEYLYLGKAENNSINSFPASGAFYPWENKEPEKRAKERTLEVEIDNKEHKSKLKVSSGDTFYGPVSLEKGEFEYNRLIKTYNSIALHGFKVDIKGSNNIGAIILENDGAYRYFIIRGQHRVAALSALDYKDVILQVKKSLIVRRSEACYWPGVMNKYFTEAEALKIFDRIFEG